MLEFRLVRSRRLVAIGVLFFVIQSIRAQSISQAVVGPDKKLHLSYANGDTKVIPPEPEQVGCEHISVARDKHTAGWSVLADNCCTSYPVPTSVVIFKDDKKTVISTGQMIYDWQFVRRGERVAILSGPVHGSASAAGLYNSGDGKLLESWNGKGAAPKWAQAWKAKFEQEP